MSLFLQRKGHLSRGITNWRTGTERNISNLKHIFTCVLKAQQREHKFKEKETMNRRSMAWVKVFVRQTWESVSNLFPHNHIKGDLRSALWSIYVVKTKLAFWLWVDQLSGVLDMPSLTSSWVTFFTLAVLTGANDGHC